MDLLNTYGQNSWAVVTGASDGIGRGFCEELARIGFNIVLISRTKTKLDTVAKSLTEINPSIKTKIIIYDFSINNKTFNYIESFSNLLSELDISILVNNVGISFPKLFSDLTITEVKDFIAINIIPQTMLSKVILNQLSNRMNTNAKSAIINLSSTTYINPLYMYSQYAATKAFNLFLSKGMEYECKHDKSNTNKVDIIAVTPGLVATSQVGYTSREANGYSVCTPNQCANSVLDNLGFENETAGYWFHQLQIKILYFISSIVCTSVLYALTKNAANDLNKRMIKFKEKEMSESLIENNEIN